jgi:hypothetical protein
MCLLLMMVPPHSNCSPPPANQNVNNQISTNSLPTNFIRQESHPRKLKKPSFVPVDDLVDGVQVAAVLRQQIDVSVLGHVGQPRGHFQVVKDDGCRGATNCRRVSGEAALVGFQAGADRLGEGLLDPAQQVHHRLAGVDFDAGSRLAVGSDAGVVLAQL